jgi:DNA-binding GntR family transcriptional regulator
MQAKNHRPHYAARPGRKSAAKPSAAKPSAADASGATPNGAGPGAASGKTLTDRIRQAVEHDIVSGRLVPGTKLDEDRLASRHGASRTPVREALQHLASRGLIELRPHAGAFVPERSVVDLAEMFEAMSFLEAACAALAARRHSAADRNLLAAAHDACASAAKRDDPEAFYAANAHFHGRIYAAAHNEYLASQTMAEHERILKAILAMDEAAAGTQMRGHLDTLRDDVVSMATAMRGIGRENAR